MTLRTFKRDQVGRKFHVEYPVMKHVENSLRGTTWAHRHHYRTTDLDLLPDEVLVKAALRAVSAGTTIPRSAIVGHIPNEHWVRPLRRDGFRDPKGVLHRDDKITAMVPEEWGRLKARSRFHSVQRHTYQILPIERQITLLPTLGEHGMQGLLEPKECGKASVVWLRHEVWEYLAEIAEAHRAKIAVYSLFHECLPYARDVGFNAWKIN